MDQHTELSGSEQPLFNKKGKKRVKRKELISFKLILKAHHKRPVILTGLKKSKDKKNVFKDKFGVNDERRILIQEFATFYNLEIVRINEVLGLIKMQGLAKDVEKAFKVDLHFHSIEDLRKAENQKIRSYVGPLFIPKKIHWFVDAVIGLSKVPFKHQALVNNPIEHANTQATGHAADWFAEHYNYPSKYNGKGQSIGIISCGGSFSQSELDKYYKKVKIEVTNPVKVVSVGGIIRKPTEWQHDYEINTDIQVAQGAAPGAQLVVYNTENSLDGFVEAIELICKNKKGPKIITYSWASSENAHSKKGIQAIERVLQLATLVYDISIIVCTGDMGSTNEEENNPKTPLMPTYPATSNWVTACGGTMFKSDKKGKTKEVVWQSSFLYKPSIKNGSGGGFSYYLQKPPYQIDAISVKKYPKKYADKRGIPDIAAYADVAVGSIAYLIMVDGNEMMTGGTSSSTPLWAALIARINQSSKSGPIGFLNPWLYKMKANGINSITKGSNSMPDGPINWKAQKSWDPCTGLGIPDGEKMVKWFKKNRRPS